jgi:hypothetical protein
VESAALEELGMKEDLGEIQRIKMGYIGTLGASKLKYHLFKVGMTLKHM